MSGKPGVGTVLGTHPGLDNHGKRGHAARVCWDNAERGDLAYPFLFSELKKR